VRFLHTSDWHVGKAIRGRSRAGEHAEVLAEIAGVAAAEEVDVVLVVGDLFETAAPPPDAERIVYRALLDLAATGATVVVVAGNHDNARRLQAVEPLFDLGRVVVRSHLAPPDAGGVIDVASRDGAETARIALVPFLSQRWIVRADDLMGLDAGEHAGRYAERLRLLLERLTAGFGPDTVNVVAAHLMAHGGVMGGGERSAHTIFDYSVPGTAFPASAHYVALGHLHRTQEVAAPCPARYSGSPLQLDFGESADDKVVLVVDAAPGRPASVREVPLRGGRRLRTVRGTLTELEAAVGTTGDDHLRVVVCEAPRAGLADEMRELFPDAVEVRVEPPEAREGPPRRPDRSDRAPRQLFADYLEERNEADERLLALFDELYDEVSG
jgi:DNA repair protein SbcD/Mre11